MEKNKVKYIRDFGQSIWLDFLDRELNDYRIKKFSLHQCFDGFFYPVMLEGANQTRAYLI